VIVTFCVARHGRKTITTVRFSAVATWQTSVALRFWARLLSGGGPVLASPAMSEGISITVNGDTHTVPAGITIAGLIDHLGLTGRRVAVERNKAVVPRALHPETALAAGDRLELVTFVGGG